ncbi:MAG TPA: hypothetical protein VFI42_19925 [Thermomicrobiaceae bacterium]|nr:hypothetical protein [Thermomicrobiaceae bacterium]
MGKPNDAQRGKWGAWIKHAADEKGWTASILRDKLADQGYPISVSTIHAWWNGSTRPDRNRIGLIEAVLGVAAPREPDPEIGRLVDALEVQSRALAAYTRQVHELLMLLGARAASGTGAGVARAVAEAGRSREEGATPDTPLPLPGTRSRRG